MAVWWPEFLRAVNTAVLGTLELYNFRSEMEASYSIKKRTRGKGRRGGLVDEDQIVKMEGRKLNSTIGAGWQREPLSM